jgi:hypothetical protein
MASFGEAGDRVGVVEPLGGLEIDAPLQNSHLQESRTGASRIGSASCVNALTQLKLRCMSAFATRTPCRQPR